MAKRGRPRKDKNLYKNPLEKTEKELKESIDAGIQPNPLVEKNNNQISDERRDRLNATLREINKVMPGSVQ